MIPNLSIANRLREVLLDGHWIANTNYKDQIENLHWQTAIEKLNNVNSIAALVYHINYYLAGLLEAFESGKLDIHDNKSFNLLPIRSAADWEELMAEFLSNAEKFVSTIEEMDNTLFDQSFIDLKYGSYLRNIEGVIEHSYYHLGQIVMIKKMLMENTK